MDLIQCELAQIMIAEQRGAQVIVLRECEGERIFPIEIGLFEALAINRHISGEEMIRPMTHDLLLSVMAHLGGSLKRIVVSELVETVEGQGTFYGLLVVERDGEEIEIDTRPSDAIALAVREGCPLFVSEDVLQKVSWSGES